MEKLAAINILYFEEKKTLTEIANIINTSVSYISKIIRKDSRYKIEKEKRKQETLKNRREIQKNMIYASRKSNTDTAFLYMKTQHEKDIKELSKYSTVGNEALRKWCNSAYKYNKDKNRYEFDNKSLLKPADFPMFIKA